MQIWWNFGNFLSNWESIGFALAESCRTLSTHVFFDLPCCDLYTSYAPATMIFFQTQISTKFTQLQKFTFNFPNECKKKTSEQTQKTTFWLEHIQTIQHSFFQKIYVRFLCKTRSSKCKWHFTLWQIRKFHHISKLFPIYFLLRPFSFHIFTFLAFDSNDREGKPRPQKRNWKFFSRRIRILSS